MYILTRSSLNEKIKFTIFVYISTRLSLEIYFPIRNKILDIIRTEIKYFLNNNLTFTMENIIVRVIPFLQIPIILLSF